MPTSCDEAGVSSPVLLQAWAKCMENLGCPDIKFPLSAMLVESKGKDEPIHLVPAQLQELPEGKEKADQPP